MEVNTIVGVYADEKQVPQRLHINLEVGVPTDRACASDKLRDTVDYASVVAFVRNEIDTQHFSLLERLADHLCRRLCAHFAAPWVHIAISKPNKIPGVAEVGVKLRYEAAGN